MKNVVSKSTTIDVDKIQGYEGFQPHLYFDLKQYTHAMTTSTAAFDAALQRLWYIPTILQQSIPTMVL